MPDSIMSEPSSATDRFERTLAAGTAERVVLRLFIAGMTSRSLEAIADLRKLAAEQIGTRCSIEVVDIFQQPERAAAEQIVAVPCLVKERPSPLRRVLGSLNDQAMVLGALQLVG